MALSHEAPSESDTKIYEMRTYYVKPKAFGKGNNMIVPSIQILVHQKLCPPENKESNNRHKLNCKISSHLSLYILICFLAADFMKLTNEYSSIHLKSDSNSKLKGYWTSDIGGLNEVTHIWEYGTCYDYRKGKLNPR